MRVNVRVKRLFNALKTNTVVAHDEIRSWYMTYNEVTVEQMHFASDYYDRLVAKGGREVKDWTSDELASLNNSIISVDELDMLLEHSAITTWDLADVFNFTVNHVPVTVTIEASV